MAFIEDGYYKDFTRHDDAYQCVRGHTKLTESWNKEIGGGHSWKKTPRYFESIIHFI